MTKFTVDRQTWLRGRGQGTLRSESGEMCCLGFFCNQIGGVSLKSLMRFTYPASLVNANRLTDEEKKKIGVLLEDNTGYAGYAFDSLLGTNAARINDNINIDDGERESQLTALFAEEGFEVEFVN